MLLIDRLVDYVGPHDPEFRDRIHGAREEDIAELQRLAKHALPADYVEFLERMGNHDGGLRLGGDSPTDIAEILTYYRDVVDAGEEDLLLPPGMIVIAYMGVGSFELSLRVGEGPGPRVYDTSGSDIKGIQADSLESALFRAAFVTFRMRTFPVSGIYWGHPGESSLNKVIEASLNLGYRREPFSDSVAFCGEAGDRALIVQTILGRPPWVRIAAADTSAIEADATVLNEAMDLTLQQWWPS